MPVRLEVRPITRPASSSEEDLLAYEEEMTDRERRNLVGYDIRFTKFLGYIALASFTLMTAAITWSAATLVGLKSDVAVLLARPLGISREQYERDSKRWDEDIEELKQLHRRTYNDHP